MYATWLDSNSWLLEIAGQTILVDPWLVGPLVFLNQTWFFKGEHPRPLPLPAKIDLILLSQGLEDHAHPETLRALDKAIPVVGSPNAARVVTGLGYEQVQALAPGETFVLADAVEIKAVPGTSFGPSLTENGYVLRDLTSGLSLFYEPHGFHQPSLKEEGPIDVVITPVMDMALPLVGPLINGQKASIELIEWLQPQAVLPTADAGEVQYHGLLLNALKFVGGPKALQAQLDQQGQLTRVFSPTVGERLDLQLTPRSVAA